MSSGAVLNDWDDIVDVGKEIRIEVTRINEEPKEPFVPLTFMGYLRIVGC